jgi:hypothetical protein
VSVDEVSVHSDTDGWKIVRSDSFFVDLLSLPAHPINVGSVALSPGKVTQVRLVTSGGSVITSDNKTEPLRIPSGSQTGIKLDGPWLVGACQLVALHLEFEPLESVHVHAPGEDDGWILNPVIHVAEDPPVLFMGCPDLTSMPPKVPGGYLGHP